MTEHNLAALRATCPMPWSAVLCADNRFACHIIDANGWLIFGSVPLITAEPLVALVNAYDRRELVFTQNRKDGEANTGPQISAPHNDRPRSETVSGAALPDTNELALFIKEQSNYWCQNYGDKKEPTLAQFLSRAITDRLAKSLAPSINAEMVEALKEIRHSCKRASHPAAPIVLSEAHLSHLEQIASRCESAITRTQTALREGNGTTGENDPLVDLVKRFSAALLSKLQAARTKYGHGEGWRDDHWEDDCQRALLKHLAKGDPRDVAAYCAFMWHHGWSTVAPSPSPPTAAVDRKAIAKIICKSHPRNDCVQDEGGRSPCDAKNCYYISVADSIIALLNGGRHEG